MIEKNSKKTIYVLVLILSVALLMPSEVEAKKGDPHLRLVNPKNKISSKFVPKKLVKIKNLSEYDSKYISRREEIRMEKTAAKQLLKMLKSANTKAGHKFYLYSGYRSYATQKQSCGGQNNAVRNSSGLVTVAAPGTSEHQTGLAIDITGLGNSKSYSYPKKGTPERWLLDNCHKYGFIYRYQGKYSGETGVANEPWHLRYIGVDDAKNLHKLDISFEKYIKNYDKYTTAKVIFKTNKGEFSKEKYSGKSSITKKIKLGKKLKSLPNVERTGFVFKGWYTKKAGGTKISNNTKINKKTILYARWEKEIVDVPEEIENRDINP